MSEKPKPDDPLFKEVLSPLQEAAIVMHEQFLAFLKAGFTEEQSLRILISLTEGMMYTDLADDENYD
jgi:hypothetical protein